MTIRSAACVYAGLLIAVTCSGVWAQGMGPEAYGLPAYFGMNSPVSTRHLGMGVPMACLDGDQFANPAFAANRSSADAALRVVTTDLDAGPRLTSMLANYGRPIRAGVDGWHVTWLSLDSSNGGATLPGVGAVKADMSEDALLVDYGRVFENGLLAGLAVLGYEESEFTLSPPVGPPLSRLNSEADFGLRVGLAYEWAPEDYVGLTFSYAQNSVDASGLLLGAVSHTVFNSTQLAIGASAHVRPDVVALVEYRRGCTGNGGYEKSVNTWHLGAEYEHPSGAAVRVGMADESPTFGLGYNKNGWSLDYAYIGDWNDDATSALFGGSDTHSLQATYCW